MGTTTGALWPVLEIGGTHLATAVVDDVDWSIVPGSVSHRSFDATGSSGQLIAAMADAGSGVSTAHGSDWAVAIPGPFDYEAGVGRFEHVGKFDSLNGVDVRRALLAQIEPAPASIRFLNDADAFGVGEFVVGAARGHDRVICLTLGTGVGSAFLDRGEPVNSGPSVPPDGSAHLVRYRGRPLEEFVSRRAIRSAYAAASGSGSGDGPDTPDVHEIAERSRLGDAAAATVLRDAFEALGLALTPAIRRFQATAMVIGGSMSRSWDIVEPALRRGLTEGGADRDAVELLPAQFPSDAAFVGAAYGASRR